jgi:hypothetical protein
VHEQPSSKAPEIRNAENAWAYTTGDGRIRLWIYEFRGQHELDNGMAELEPRLNERQRPWDFAQNGEFLLLAELNDTRQLPEYRKAIDKILQAFAGEVER